MAIKPTIFAIITFLVILFVFIAIYNVILILEGKQTVSILEIIELNRPLFLSSMISVLFGLILFYILTFRYLRNEILPLTKELSSVINKINNEILVLHEIDKDLNIKQINYEKKNKELEERIIAVEKLLVELINMIKSKKT